MGNKVPTSPQPKSEPTQTVKFEPYKGKFRKPSTGCISKINDHLYEGRYSPKWVDGKRKICTTYAKTEVACEEQLATLIANTKAELARLKTASQKTKKSLRQDYKEVVNHPIMNQK